ncbi:MAG: efflux RND transporter periplasmic adaptor subunit [Lachnospiraceae bacterium]|nr:efflux RND transporter periplasmic adaptor subunit [Lachnospiraceae bacterium]
MEFIKNRKKMIALGAAILALVIGLVSISAHAALSVSSYTVARGSLSSVTELNSTIQTNDTVKYYSPIDGVIGTILVKEGDYVNKGDLLISYNEADMEYQLAMADIDTRTDQGSYDEALQSSNRTAGLYSQAANSLPTLEQQIAATQVLIAQKEMALLERKASLADEGAKLQVSLIEWADEPDSDEYENLQKLIQTNAYEQQYASDIVQMQEELTCLNIQLGNYQAKKSEMTSQKMATYSGVLTQGGKDRIEAVKEANDLANTQRLEDLNYAKDGIKADFDGVVTKINAVEGNTAKKGEELAVLESIEDVIVRANVNKYDIDTIAEDQPATVKIRGIDYPGKVTRIERMMDADSGTGIGVEITLDEPDENIILGLEVKSRIQTAALENVLQIPLTAYNSDEDGEYVFVVKNKKAVKTFVEAGAKNDDMIEICSGLNEGDVVVWNESVMLTDGMDVNIK